MSEMVERVAAMLAELNPTCNTDWRVWVDDARAIISAMREPTPEMIQAGERTLTEPRDVSGYPCGCDERAVWQAMVDAALTTETKPKD